MQQGSAYPVSQGSLAEPGSVLSDGFSRPGSEGYTGMVVSTKTKMSLEDFGKALLDTRDLGERERERYA
jgi:hypothetical protein